MDPLKPPVSAEPQNSCPGTPHSGSDAVPSCNVAALSRPSGVLSNLAFTTEIVPGTATEGIVHDEVSPVSSSSPILSSVLGLPVGVDDHGPELGKHYSVLNSSKILGSVPGGSSGVNVLNDDASPSSLPAVGDAVPLYPIVPSAAGGSSKAHLRTQLTGSGDGGAPPPSSALPSPSAQDLQMASCPVRGRSGWTDGPYSAPSSAPQVPDTSHLPSHSNFEFCSSMFPPLQSNSASLENTPPPTLPKDLSGDACELVGAKGKHPSDWASLLKASPSSMQLKYIKPEFRSIEGKVTIKLPSSVALKGSSIWKNTMVGVDARSL